MSKQYSLKDITSYLESKDYKNRMIGEYLFVKDKATKLDDMIDKYYDGGLGFTPSCPMSILEAQVDSMWAYVKILEHRADLEMIDLPTR